ncbi:hypothetical protein CCS01_19940 [Rhodopila globiformis]|uniref:Uncharacterized protein n=2 Tax=Rhodopila globiformis TaxID=1071 RepID=A0A2S6N6E1_RHOGL|nr:hypothetical protein CCS01_19940 [Rhodopila globiformis]
MRTRTLLWGMAAVGLALALIGTFTWAQPSSGSNVTFDAPGLIIRKSRPMLPEVKAKPQAWPRLDAGAVLCQTEDDLDRLAARRRGDPVAGPIACQILQGVTPVAILQRKGSGKTEVRTIDPMAGGLGWTDAWLAERPAMPVPAGFR